MALDGADGRALRHARDRTAAALAERPGLPDASAEYLAILRQIADSVNEPDSRQDVESSAADSASDISLPDPAANGGGTADQVQTYGYGVTDLEGRAVTYSILGPPEAGTVSDNGDGTFSFDPGGDFLDLAAGETRDVSFTYQASDGQGGTATATVAVTVTGAGDRRVDLIEIRADAAAETLPAADVNGHQAESAPGEDRIDVLHMDGISGEPGDGGWSIHLDSGEILERNGDNLVLSRGAVGVIVLTGSGEIAFEGIDRIEWQPFEVA